jgi:uncharacterized protein
VFERLRRFFPTAEQIRANPWVRWLGPALQHPRLWCLSRRGIAMGVALGVFFGLLVPIAQIPLSAAAAVALRANVPVAVASTLVSNPATFGPIYYAAWKVGSALLGEPDTEPPPLAAEAEDTQDGASWFVRVWNRIADVGKPLVLGLSLFAAGFGVLSYLLVSWLWALRVRRRRQLRLRQQAATRARCSSASSARHPPPRSLP